MKLFPCGGSFLVPISRLYVSSLFSLSFSLSHLFLFSNRSDRENFWIESPTLSFPLNLLSVYDIMNTVNPTDELMEYQKEQNIEVPVTRSINFILDHSAFVRGIGNIKRWFNDEYVKSNLNSNDLANVKLYIPSYTLHEFEFLKKGTSMMATNSREAIRFIDKWFENDMNENVNENMNLGNEKNLGNEVEPENEKNLENEVILENEKSLENESKPEILENKLQDSKTTNSKTKSKSKKSKAKAKAKSKSTGSLKLSLLIESSREAGPQWHHCLEYQKHIPKIKEFPNYKTKFDSNLIGKFPKQKYNEDFKSNDIQYENSKSYQQALENSENDAEMPSRLKFLVRTCIYKRFIEKNSFQNSNQYWKVVTEDPITKIWLNSFGIDCLNVNEAELLMFENHDVTFFKVLDPHNTYDNSNEYDVKSNILQNTIDTTLYTYTTGNINSGKTEASGKKGETGDKKAGKDKKRANNKKVKGVVTGTSSINGEVVKKERFDAINYAPRGQGELWKPSVNRL